MQKKIFFILVTILVFLLNQKFALAEGVQIPGGDIIKDSSIQLSHSNESSINVEKARDIGLWFLNVARILISALALIYIVLIGGMMVLNSSDEGKISTQKKQIFLTLIGFLFLNIPTLIFDLFAPSTGWRTISGAWDKDAVLVNGAVLSGFIEWFNVSLRILVFIAAATMFTWSAFTLITSRGEESIKKVARNRLLYWLASLLFLGIVEAWTSIFSSNDIRWKLSDTLGDLFGLAFFFVGPVAIFFLMVGAYYYITSGGDESRTKKGKAIIFNTFIATVILLAAFSFIKELSSISTFF